MAGTHDFGSKKCKRTCEKVRKDKADSWIWVGVDQRMTKRAAQRNQRRKPEKPPASGFA